MKKLPIIINIKKNRFCSFFAILNSLILVLSSSGCGGSRENDLVPVTDAGLEQALVQTINNTILPRVKSFETSATLLEYNTGLFCQNPTLAALDVAQESWRDVSQHWYRLSVYNFGPANDDIVFPTYIFIDSLRLRGTDYLQTVRSEISKNIASDAILDESFFEIQNFQKVGLLLLESLLFETSTENSLEPFAIVSEYQVTSRKCDLLTGASRLLSKKANYINNGWWVSFKGTGIPFSQILRTNELEDGSDSLATILVSIQTHLDYLQKRNVVSVSARLSGHAWENVTASVDEIETFLVGSNESNVSYLSLMQAAGFDSSVTLVEENIQKIRQAIENKQVDLLGSELGHLDGNFKREIPGALAVELGINFTDGD